MKTHLQFRDTPTGALSASQLVLDPSALIQSVKTRLLEKEGIPCEHQRLVFCHPCAVAAAEHPASEAPSAGAELLSELDKWQAILYRNDKAVGRCVSPQLYSVESGLGGARQLSGAGLPVELLSLQFTQFQPVALRGAGPASIGPLHLPVDDLFRSATYRVQIIGRSGGRPIALPFAFEFCGRDTAAALGLSLQRLEFWVHKHQKQWSKQGVVEQEQEQEACKDLTIDCGSGVQQFCAVFDISAQPAWLKSLVLRFALVAKQLLDEALPGQRQGPGEGQPGHTQPASMQPAPARATARLVSQFPLPGAQQAQQPAAEHTAVAGMAAAAPPAHASGPPHASAAADQASSAVAAEPAVPSSAKQQPPLQAQPRKKNKHKKSKPDKADAKQPPQAPASVPLSNGQLEHVHVRCRHGDVDRPCEGCAASTSAAEPEANGSAAPAAASKGPGTAVTRGRATNGPGSAASDVSSARRSQPPSRSASPGPPMANGHVDCSHRNAQPPSSDPVLTQAPAHPGHVDDSASISSATATFSTFGSTRSEPMDASSTNGQDADAAAVAETGSSWQVAGAKAAAAHKAAAAKRSQRKAELAAAARQSSALRRTDPPTRSPHHAWQAHMPPGHQPQVPGASWRSRIGAPPQQSALSEPARSQSTPSSSAAHALWAPSQPHRSYSSAAAGRLGSAWGPVPAAAMGVSLAGEGGPQPDDQMQASSTATSSRGNAWQHQRSMQGASQPYSIPRDGAEQQRMAPASDATSRQRSSSEPAVDRGIAGPSTAPSSSMPGSPSGIPNAWHSNRLLGTRRRSSSTGGAREAAHRPGAQQTTMQGAGAATPATTSASQPRLHWPVPGSSAASAPNQAWRSAVQAPMKSVVTLARFEPQEAPPSAPPETETPVKPARPQPSQAQHPALQAVHRSELPRQRQDFFAEHPASMTAEVRQPVAATSKPFAAAQMSQPRPVARSQPRVRPGSGEGPLGLTWSSPPEMDASLEAAAPTQRQQLRQWQQQAMAGASMAQPNADAAPAHAASCAVSEAQLASQPAALHAGQMPDPAAALHDAMGAAQQPSAPMPAAMHRPQPQWRHSTPHGHQPPESLEPSSCGAAAVMQPNSTPALAARPPTQQQQAPQPQEGPSDKPAPLRDGMSAALPVRPRPSAAHVAASQALLDQYSDSFGGIAPGIEPVVLPVLPVEQTSASQGHVQPSPWQLNSARGGQPLPGNTLHAQAGARAGQQQARGAHSGAAHPVSFAAAASASASASSSAAGLMQPLVGDPGPFGYASQTGQPSGQSPGQLAHAGVLVAASGDVGDPSFPNVTARKAAWQVSHGHGTPEQMPMTSSSVSGHTGPQHMNKGSLRDSAPAQPSGSAAIPGPAAELIGAHRGPPSQQRGALQSEAHEASVGQTTAVRSTAGASAIQHRMQTGSEAAASTAKGGTVRQPALHGLPNGYNAPGRLSEPDSHPGTRGAVNGEHSSQQLEREGRQHPNASDDMTAPATPGGRSTAKLAATSRPLNGQTVPSGHSMSAQQQQHQHQHQHQQPPWRPGRPAGSAAMLSSSVSRPRAGLPRSSSERQLELALQHFTSGMDPRDDAARRFLRTSSDDSGRAANRRTRRAEAAAQPALQQQQQTAPGSSTAALLQVLAPPPPAAWDRYVEREDVMQDQQPQQHAQRQHAQPAGRSSQHFSSRPQMEADTPSTPSSASTSSTAGGDEPSMPSVHAAASTRAQSASYVHAPGNSSSGAKEPQRLEKGTSSRPLAAPRALQPPKLVPLTDLERLLAAITPTLDVGPLKGNAMRLCLADVWGCFHEASLYAREVYTLSGARGPAISYYVPFLSAMQLFLPAGPPPSQATSAQPPGQPSGQPADSANHGQQPPASPLLQRSASQAGPAAAAAGGTPPDAAPAGPSSAGGEDHAAPVQPGSQQPAAPATRAPGAGGVPHRLYQSDSEWGGWGRSLRPLAELFATELPFNRVPLYDKVLQLAKGPCADGLPGRLLLDARLCDLHPASWFSVAWYPVYRIPDAPLNARFLTFHSLSPVPAAAGPGNASAHTRLLALPPVGLKWCNLQGERWLEPLAPQRPSEGTAPERPADSRASSREASPESAAAPASLSSNGGSGGPAVAGDPGRGQARGRESPDQSGNGTAPPAAAAVAAKHNPGSAEAAALLSASLAGHPVVAVAADGQQADPMAAAAAVARQARFSELQATAERLARGTGLQVLGDKGFEDAKLRHPDFEFFHSRG